MAHAQKLQCFVDKIDRLRDRLNGLDRVTFSPREKATAHLWKPHTSSLLVTSLSGSRTTVLVTTKEKTRVPLRSCSCANLYNKAITASRGHL